jgi:hypothetical protein
MRGPICWIKASTLADSSGPSSSRPNCKRCGPSLLISSSPSSGVCPLETRMLRSTPGLCGWETDIWPASLAELEGSQCPERAATALWRPDGEIMSRKEKKYPLPCDTMYYSPAEYSSNSLARRLRRHGVFHSLALSTPAHVLQGSPSEHCPSDQPSSICSSVSHTTHTPSF